MGAETPATGGLDWFNMGSSLLSGLIDGGPSSAATAIGAPVSQNNSGFSVTNTGDAVSDGGEQSTDAALGPVGGPNGFPWYVWIAGGLFAYALVKRL